MQKREAVAEYMSRYGGDGHSIIRSQGLVEMGFDAEFVAKYTRDHESGDTFKSMIFDQHGNVFKTCHGVDSRIFAYGIAEDMGLDTSEARGYTGRGFQAQALAQIIGNKLSEESA